MKNASKKSLSRSLALMLCAALILPVSASCKKKEKKVNTPLYPDGTPRELYVKEDDPYFTATTIDLTVPIIETERKLEGFGIHGMKFSGDNILVGYTQGFLLTAAEAAELYDIDYNDPEEILRSYELTFSQNIAGIQIFAEDGTQKGKVELSIYEGLNEIKPLTGGRFAVTVDEFLPEEQEDRSKLLIVNEKGEREQEIVLEDGMAAAFLDELADGNLLLVSQSYNGHQVVLIDNTGKIYAQAPFEEEVVALFPIGDKEYVLSQETEYTGETTIWHRYLHEVNITDGTLGAPTEIDSTMPYQFRFSNGKLYGMDEDGNIYLCDLQKGTQEPVFIKEYADVVLSGMSDIRVNENGDIDILYSRYEGSGPTARSYPYMTRLHKEEKNPHAGKRIIYAASCTDSMSAFDEMVAAYNRRPESKCRVVSYVQQIDPETAYSKAKSTAADKLLLDMKSGYGPDILLDCAEFSQFNSDKILLDLNTFIDGENGLSRDSLFDNIFRAFEVDGKLYQMPIICYLEGFNGNPDLLGRTEGWTVDEFDAKMSALPDGVFPLFGYTAELNTQEGITVESKLGILLSLLYSDMSHYVDYSGNKANFDSDDFRKLMEVAAKYGDRLDSEQYMDLYERYDDWSYHNIESLIMQDGVSALSTMICSNLASFGAYADLNGGDPLFIGWPTTKGKGVSANAQIFVGISAFSDCPQEAWDFCAYLTGYEAQELFARSGWRGISINREMAENAFQLEIESYEELVELYKDYPERAEMSAELNADVAKKYIALIERIDTSIQTNPVIVDIIIEEAPAYFNGQKTAEEVSRIIQQRATTLLQESK